MGGRRVLVTGAGGELGSLVAASLEAEPWVGELRGIDGDPPRRRLRRCEFQLLDPHDHEGFRRAVLDFEPQVLVHFAVYEPHARTTPERAARWTPGLAGAVLHAASEVRALERVVIRSGIEVYGRGGGRSDDPDESAPLSPTSSFGRHLADAEAHARLLAEATGVPVARLRLAPVLGPHLPSPLGRLLRLPIVPIDGIGIMRRVSWQVVDSRDAARAAVLAATAGHDGALNVVSGDAVRSLDAMRLGGRIPVPVAGLQWIAANAAATVQGAPIPDHVRELLARGRRANGTEAVTALGFEPVWSARQVVASLYSWSRIIHVAPGDRHAMEAVEGGPVR